MSAGITRVPAHEGDDGHVALADVMLREHAAWPGDLPCPVRDLMARVGDTWTLLVILHLGSEGPRRFRQLLRGVDGISQRMLTRALRALERDGLVLRRVFDTNPPSVEYRLTALGASLLVPLRALAEWASATRDEVAAARAAFDERGR